MADVENMVMGSDDNKNNEQPSIMVPLDDMDSVSADSPHTVDELAQELASDNLPKKLLLSEAVTYRLRINR